MSTEETLSRNLVFNILSSPRRRYVLYYLRKHGGEVELSELSSQIAAWENETEVENLTDQERKRVYVSLYQTHIPKLKEVGLIEYDKDSGVVTLTDRASEIDSYLTNESTPSIRWELYYFGLSVVSGLLILGKLLDVGALGFVSESMLTVLVVMSFGLSALVHYVLEKRWASVEVPPELRAENES
jgi:DNA-binding transcriptional ArsR family regulator